MFSIFLTQFVGVNLARLKVAGNLLKPQTMWLCQKQNQMLLKMFRVSGERRRFLPDTAT
jgi:hypothetical protein